MQDELQDLSTQEAAAIAGGDGALMYYIGALVGWMGHATTDAFLTPPPDGDFNWARDK
jgi:hypothetical protein